MLTRRILTAGLGLAFLTPDAAAQQPEPSEPVLILDASLDPDDRLTVLVTINEQGPFEFIVDSGAGRTVLSEPLADRLGLAGGPNVLVHGVSGAQLTRAARVGSLRVGDARLSNVILPVLSAERVGADGLLGVDILEGRNVIMDFGNRKLEIRRSRTPFGLVRMPREVSVVADDRFGRLTVADCRVAGARALAFIDSGGGVSIGNLALSRAISARRRRLDEVRPARLMTASGEIRIGEYRVTPSLTLGELRVTNVPMAFADLHIFNLWGLNDRPALLLGVDVLQLFSRVELDFGVGRVRFQIGGVSPTRMVGA